MLYVNVSLSPTDRNLFAKDIEFTSIRIFGGKVNSVVDNATLVSEIEKPRSIIRDKHLWQQLVRSNDGSVRIIARDSKVKV